VSMPRCASIRERRAVLASCGDTECIVLPALNSAPSYPLMVSQGNIFPTALSTPD
jgi:hypothetical protein